MHTNDPVILGEYVTRFLIQFYSQEYSMITKETIEFN